MESGTYHLNTQERPHSAAYSRQTDSLVDFHSYYAAATQMHSVAVKALDNFICQIGQEYEQYNRYVEEGIPKDQISCKVGRIILDINGWNFPAPPPQLLPQTVAQGFPQSIWFQPTWPKPSFTSQGMYVSASPTETSVSQSLPNPLPFPPLYQDINPNPPPNILSLEKTPSFTYSIYDQLKYPSGIHPTGPLSNPPKIPGPPKHLPGPPHQSPGPPHHLPGPPHQSPGPPHHPPCPPQQPPGPPHHPPGSPQQPQGPPHHPPGPPHHPPGPLHQSPGPPQHPPGPPHHPPGPLYHPPGPPQHPPGPAHRPPHQPPGPPKPPGPPIGHLSGSNLAAPKTSPQEFSLRQTMETKTMKTELNLDCCSSPQISSFGCGHSFCANCSQSSESDLTLQSQGALPSNCKLCSDFTSKEQSNKDLKIFNSLINADAPNTLAAVFECPICLVQCKIEGSITLNCDHRICFTCMKEYLENLIGRNLIKESDLKCPIPMCAEQIFEPVIAYCIQPHIYERLIDLRQKLLENPLNGERLVFCPKCDYQEFVDVKTLKLHCRVCNKDYCIMCKMEAKKSNHKCKKLKFEAEEAKKAQTAVKLSGVKQCPICKWGIVQEDGCNFMRCTSTMCRGSTYFCWLCLIPLQAEAHYSHFPTGGPYGSTCSGIKGSNKAAPNTKQPIDSYSKADKKDPTTSNEDEEFKIVRKKKKKKNKNTRNK